MYRNLADPQRSRLAFGHCPRQVCAEVVYSDAHEAAWAIDRIRRGMLVGVRRNRDGLAYFSCRW